MKTEAENYYTWDDVIFENRNRSYGAYLVRQSYSRNAMIAFGTSVSFAILLIFSPQIINYLTGGKVDLPPIIEIKKPLTEIGPPPVIELIKPILPPPSEVSAASTNLPLKVVITEPTDVILPNNQLIVDSPSISDGDIMYVEPSTGTVPVEVVAPVIPSGPLDIAEVMPAYDGGFQALSKFLSRNLRYPKTASSMGIEGTVFVSFVINADGNVVDVKVVRGVSADCDKEAMRVVSKMTEWTAGMMHQMPVSVRMMLPIKFQLNQ